MKEHQITIGIIGLGTVASGVVETLAKHKDIISSRAHTTFKIKTVAVRSLDSKRDVDTSSFALTDNVDDIINDEEIDLVVELMGGTTLAKDHVLNALNKGKVVVTANKALICEHGPEVFAAAQANKTAVFYEAAVAGGIPIIKAVNESLAGNDIESMYGIINGTCNFILTKMNEGMDFPEALQLATDLGYAEADPTLDIEGIDTAHKILILASLVYGRWFTMNDIQCQGITKITATDMSYAQQNGYTIKLLASAKKDESGAVSLEVSPTFVPINSTLGATSGAFNGIQVKGDIVGETMFYGPGAGKLPTASSVVSDLIDACKVMKYDSLEQYEGFRPYDNCSSLVSSDEAESRFYLRMELCDKPKTLSKATTAIGDEGINISDVTQRELGDDTASVIFLTHKSSRKAIDAAIAKIESLGISSAPIVSYRVEDFA